MREHPEYDILMRDFGPRFDESPWSPEFLECPWPSSFSGAVDHLKRTIALSTPTQVLEVIDGELPAG